MEILICEDCKADMNTNIELCEKYFKSNNIDGNITGIFEFDFNMEKKPDLLILDIDMPDVNGIEIKEKLMKLGWNTLIIFVTNCYDLMEDAFGKNVIGFIKKPVNPDRLNLLIGKALDIVQTNKIITLDNGSCINSKDIKMIVYEKSYSYVITRDEKIISRCTMKDWEAKLKEISFIRVNNSCIVNCSHIADFNNTYVELRDKQRIEISRRRRKTCKDAYISYCKKVAMYV